MGMVATSLFSWATVDQGRLSRPVRHRPLGAVMVAELVVLISRATEVNSALPLQLRYHRGADNEMTQINKNVQAVAIENEDVQPRKPGAWAHSNPWRLMTKSASS